MLKLTLCTSLGSSSSVTHGSTCHLNANNVHLLRSNEFELIEAQLANLDALAELQCATSIMSFSGIS